MKNHYISIIIISLFSASLLSMQPEDIFKKPIKKNAPKKPVKKIVLKKITKNPTKELIKQNMQRNVPIKLAPVQQIYNPDNNIFSNLGNFANNIERKAKIKQLLLLWRTEAQRVSNSITTTLLPFLFEYTRLTVEDYRRMYPQDLRPFIDNMIVAAIETVLALPANIGFADLEHLDIETYSEEEIDSLVNNLMILTEQSNQNKKKNHGLR